MINLSQSQKAAVECEEKYVLIIAGAGSGKTRVLTERIFAFIERLQPGRKIIGITFSNKAAEELKERLEKRMDPEELSAKAFIGTLHSFFAEFVLDRGETIGLPAELQICSNDDDRKKILWEAITDFAPSVVSIDPKANQNIVDAFLRKISEAKKVFREPEDFSEDDLQFSRVFKAYNSGMLSQGMMDFDDILRYSYMLLKASPSIGNLYRRVYKTIFVDEGQDLNYAQYTLLKLLAGSDMGITIVGDPKQAIYGFNGSSSEYMVNAFDNDYHPAKCEIPENYRSAKAIIHAAQCLEPDYRPNLNLPFQGFFGVISAESEENEAHLVLQMFCHLRDDGSPDIEGTFLRPESCAVIARNRYAFRAIEDGFRAESIPFTVKTQSSKEISAESDLFHLFVLGLSLCVNPRDKIHLSEFNDCASNIPYLGFKTYSNLFDCSDNPFAFGISRALELAQNQGNDANLCEALNVLLGLSERIEELEGRLSFEDDIARCKKMYESFVRMTVPGSRTLRAFLGSVSLGKLGEQIMEGVTFTTVHMAKGLEYDVVFIVGVTEGGFPDYRAITEFANGNVSPMEEEKHDMFVAITRAKRICYVTYPKTRKTQRGRIIDQRPSRFISSFSMNDDK